MIRFLALSILIFVAIGCRQNTSRTVHVDPVVNRKTIHFYSKNIPDSLTIFVNLPNNYDTTQPQNYPVVYLLDANLYFDITATILNKYSEVGLAPSVILVGIGYKDFPTMDSLRNRDYTYPVAIPEYEMSVSGGASNFLNCINNEIIPLIDKSYHTDTLERVLAGHSLGGYFSAYALMQDLSGGKGSFSGYIAASPSLHYNRYYLLSQFKEVQQNKVTTKPIKAYFTFGGLEEVKNGEDSTIITQSRVSQQLSEYLGTKQSGHLIYKSDVFSNLDHMDTPIPTLIKGLQWMLNTDYNK